MRTAFGRTVVRGGRFDKQFIRRGLLHFVENAFVGRHYHHGLGKGFGGMNQPGWSNPIQCRQC